MITGTIVESVNFTPLQNVNIYYRKNKNTGTTSDKNGKYSIAYKKDDEIIFSHVGYAPDYHKPIKDNSIYEVTLEPGNNTLKEVEIKADPINKDWEKIVLWSVMGALVLGIFIFIIVKKKK